MYRFKYYSVLSIYTSGFRKRKSNIDIANNYVLSSRFHYFIIKTRFNVFVEITLYSTASCNTSYELKFSHRLWYIACWARIETTDVFVTLPPRQVWGQNIKFAPIFLLLTSHFMFWTSQGLKKSWWGWVVRGGGGVHRSLRWLMRMGDLIKV